MISLEELKGIYQQNFYNDPVYRLVVDSKLDGYLCPESLLEIDLEKTYSTIEVGRMIGRKDSTIRNYFNTELVSYINPEKVGNLYRLDYINILKIHMISLLYERGGKNKSQISYELGIKSGHKLREDMEKNVPVGNGSSELLEIKKYLVVEKLKTNLLEQKSDIQELKSNKTIKSIELNQWIQKKELLEERIRQRETEESYINSLTDALQALSENEQETRIFLAEQSQKKGFFSWFSKNKSKIEDLSVSKGNNIEKLRTGSLESKEAKDKRLKEIEDINQKMALLENEIRELDDEISTKEEKVSKDLKSINNLEEQLPGLPSIVREGESL